MAPFPDELDVFTVPHSRMKKLVEGYSAKVLYTDFASHEATEALLQILYSTFKEFKCHERIENEYIMHRLKHRLHELDMYDYETVVCNCHSDNRLSEMLRLVRDGHSYNQKSSAERVDYGERLANALRDFTNTFLPHMEEEEEVFQPMLVKYFDYEELKMLKEKVIEQHKKHEIKQEVSAMWSEEDDEEDVRNSNGVDIVEVEQFRGEVDVDHRASLETYQEPTKTSLDGLPPEIIMKIFSYLQPPDLGRCASVCHSFYSLTSHPSLWHCLLPAQWARGDWTFIEREYFPEDDPCCTQTSMGDIHFNDADFRSGFKLDEDADVDESEENLYPLSCSKMECMKGRIMERISLEEVVLNGLMEHVLPAVGPSVYHVSFAGCLNLKSKWLATVLINCPNLKHLDLSYAGLNDGLIEGLMTELASADDLAFSSRVFCPLLQLLDIAGCFEISDQGFMKLFNQLYGSSSKHSKRKCSLRSLNVSGCDRLTDHFLRFLSRNRTLGALQRLDLSGCWSMSGGALTGLAVNCPALQPEHLAYCDQITDGPFPESADGCRNIGCRSRFCCRSEV